MASDSKLFSFIFLTVKASANNPKAKNFLPNLLSGIKDGASKLLPLTEEEWKIGTLEGQSGLAIAKNIANTYFQVHSQNVIPYPKKPYPSLDLKDDAGLKKVTINGLENAYITGFDNYKYDASTQSISADLKLQFNYWTNNPSGLEPGQKVSPLGLNTPFILKQELCDSATQDSATCLDDTKDPFVIIGKGTFTAEISQLNFVAPIKISVEPNRVGLNFQITSLQLLTTGADTPKFTKIKAVISDSPLKDTISQLIETFMSQPTASKAIFSQMQTSLNEASNLKAISDTLNTQITNFLNLRLGAVTGELPSDSNQPDSNMVDMYLFDRIRYSLSNPTSTWYLQSLLNNYKSPSLNQLQIKNIDLGDSLKSAGFYKASLSKIVVSGLPNAITPASAMILAPPSLYMEFILGALGNHTHVDLHFSAQREMIGIMPIPMEVGFDMHVTINQATVAVQITPSGGKADDLEIQFDAIVCNIPEPADFIIKVTGVACPGIIEGVINKKSFLDNVTNSLNSELQNNLGKISSGVTTMVKELLKKQLGGGKN